MTPPPTPGTWEFTFGALSSFVAVAAIALSLILARIETLRRREAEEQRRKAEEQRDDEHRANVAAAAEAASREQLAAAVMVAVWIEIRPSGSEAWDPVTATIHVRNGHTMPIFELAIAARHGNVRHVNITNRVDVLAPNDTVRAMHTGHNNDGGLGAAIRFRDLQGQWWQRLDGGQLPVRIDGPDHRWNDDRDETWFSVP
ncbi:hypothetical protein [Cellulomonas massiliensis]|uniref:hypothetical protein n=1 Tax=Cellulomonas massiliensis TaxID=1465811 RepID=UPI00037C619A|nr:hypothetical protein [Cellulomonas massiliensis]